MLLFLIMLLNQHFFSILLRTVQSTGYLRITPLVSSKVDFKMLLLFSTTFTKVLVCYDRPVSPVVKRITIGERRSGVRFPGTSNRMQCRQQLGTAAL